MSVPGQGTIYSERDGRSDRCLAGIVYDHTCTYYVVMKINLNTRTRPLFFFRHVYDVSLWIFLHNVESVYSL